MSAAAAAPNVPDRPVVESPGFAVFDVVTIHGLTSPAGRAINKLRGTVVALPEPVDATIDPPADASQETPPDRVEVHIAGREGTVGILPANLRKLYPAYRVGPDSHGGLGTFATQPITLGSTILEEKPIGLSHPSDWANLSSADRTQVGRLARHRPAAAMDPMAVLDIINTNQFDHAGVCLVMSRVNHSCHPNCAFEFDEDTKLEHLYAVADIAAGDELTVAYTPELDTCAQRRAKLEREKGFRCRCPACMAPPAEVAKSNALVARVAQLRDTLPGFATLEGTGIAQADANSQEIVACIEQLHGSYATLLAPVAYDVMQVIASKTNPTPADLDLLKSWSERHDEYLKHRSHTTQWEDLRRLNAKWAKDPRSFVAHILRRNIARSRAAMSR